MNIQRVLLSLAMIVFAGGAIAGATGAFFSDSETSTGNTFTAGAIDLKVDSEQHYNGNVCQLGNHDGDPNTPDTYAWVGKSPYPVPNTPCDGTWVLSDLGNGAKKFFNFTDIKPGDEGENTISLHVDNNDAYACVDVALTKNDDVSTVDPETDASDSPEDNANFFDGELAQNIEFFAWVDYGSQVGWQGKREDTGEGDNVWQANEPKLFSNTSGPASDVLAGKTYTLSDSTTGAPLGGGSTSYVGLAWCAGDLDASVLGTITCNGGAMGNVAQTDMFEGSITFRVEQARNNSSFVCTRPPQS